MKTIHTLYEDGNHQWLVVARDPERPSHLIDTNEYLVTYGNHGLLADPGGAAIFPAVFSAITRRFDPSAITSIFASHQDPDLISSLALWLEFNPGIKCHTSWMWCGFTPHFGGDASNFSPLPDEGATIDIDGLPLQAIPAHYLHSSGNFSLYDAKAKIMFSGDIGAAQLPHAETPLFVEDFASHIRHAEGFHRRWMGSNEAKRDWCERVSRMDIELLCPQHGAIYRGADVQRFINWFDELRVGIIRR